MSDKLSELLTNAQASPVVFNAPELAKGLNRSATGVIELAAADMGLNDVIGLCRVPTHAIIKHIYLMTDDLDGGTALVVDAGVYENGSGTAMGAAKDANALADGSTGPRSATTAWTDIFAPTPDLAAKRLWEHAGDTADPGGEYTIGLLIETAAVSPVGGTLAFMVEWTYD